MSMTKEKQKHRDSCLPACLVSFLKDHNLPCTEDEIIGSDPKLFSTDGACNLGVIQAPSADVKKVDALDWHMIKLDFSRLNRVGKKFHFNISGVYYLHSDLHLQPDLSDDETYLVGVYEFKGKPNSFHCLRWQGNTNGTELEVMNPKFWFTKDDGTPDWKGEIEYLSAHELIYWKPFFFRIIKI